MSGDVRLILEMPLTARPEAGHEARAAMSECVSELQPVRQFEALLMATEVITNALKHAALRPPAELVLRVEERGRHLRITIEHPGETFEADPGLPPTHQPGGRGLYFVDTLADEWAIETPSEGLVRVWFEIAH
jgi:anti-sigma regulatory factor (Ser/Thr protein kinase)